MGDFLEVRNYTKNLLKVALIKFLVDIKYNAKLLKNKKAIQWRGFSAEENLILRNKTWI